ncbi:hypothetical protein GobsT_28040 [Gemmata obscuriglobus]|uniref:hypothetical protein n=1 Tax=Gemmata obscuriglobus TaxID=114 RepID=UPI00016C3904
MTEAEWFAASSVRKLLGHLSKQHSSDRKLRLFAVACGRRSMGDRASPQFREVTDEVEQLAESRTNRTRNRLKQLRRELASGASWHAAEAWIVAGLVAATGWASASRAAAAVRGSVWLWHKSREERVLVSLLRDILGNPFQPSRFSSKWRTADVVLLAQQMYGSRDFSAMPILADALQDAGCDSDAILNHCRDHDCPHVRGCWVVDLVLRKT